MIEPDGLQNLIRYIMGTLGKVALKPLSHTYKDLIEINLEVC